jgi:hypothetical protein
MTSWNYLLRMNVASENAINLTQLSSKHLNSWIDNAIQVSELGETKSRNYIRNSCSRSHNEKTWESEWWGRISSGLAREFERIHNFSRWFRKKLPEELSEIVLDHIFPKRFKHFLPIDLLEYIWFEQISLIYSKSPNWRCLRFSDWTFFKRGCSISQNGIIAQSRTLSHGILELTLPSASIILIRWIYKRRGPLWGRPARSQNGAVVLNCILTGFNEEWWWT